MARAVIVLALISCGDNVPGNITIRTASAFEPALIEYARVTQYPLIVAEVDAEVSDGFSITVVEDSALPAQAYQLAKLDDKQITVAASDILGAQYGTTAALETMGLRFRHPYDTFVPSTIKIGEVDTEIHKPDIRVRGLQLHTLHPIEPYFAFWEPSAQNTEDAHRIIDWVIKNRGNYLQWVALDNILKPAELAEWKPFTRELIDYAHVRGVRVGLNIQLFGAANLQQAYDLVDEAEEDIPTQIAARLPTVTNDLPFDVYDLSFGEFFDSEPQAFIDAVNEVKNQLAVLAPQAEMHALVHVGADQVVNFNGEDLIYYFLVKFADPAIIPDVHTVMFYNLYEPAGGAYKHEDFSAHREFLLERMCSGKPVAYQPETSYWVAFDISVPQYLPLYVHNRWLDLEMLDAEPGCGALDNHMLFSTGWEWGYWLHDVTALRASYERPSTSTALIEAEFGTDLGPAVPTVARLIEVQREQLMLGELVQYIAGRDTSIDAGRLLDIVSQPDRVTFEDLEALDPAGREAFKADVITQLVVYRTNIEGIEDELTALDLEDNRWTRELRDGVAMDRLRAAFIIELYTATLNQLAGDTEAAQSDLLRAEALMGAAQEIVSRRHGDLHDGLADKLIEETANDTLYQYGYLFMADTLCFWVRELAQVKSILNGTSESVPSCLFT
ncbi:MAG: hypothetical protein H0V17_14195 [Deltaproteobacteria bacterium]|nr:hypothetical protein [Deltaproteobacteria bacterium]